MGDRIVLWQCLSRCGAFSLSLVIRVNLPRLLLGRGFKTTEFFLGGSAFSQIKEFRKKNHLLILKCLQFKIIFMSQRYFLYSFNMCIHTHVQSYIFVRFHISPKIDPKTPIKNPRTVCSGETLEVCLLLHLKPQGAGCVFLGAQCQQPAHCQNPTHLFLIQLFSGKCFIKLVFIG